MQDRYFEEFEGRDGETILIDLYSVTAIEQVSDNKLVSLGCSYNTVIHVSGDARFFVVESYNTCKNAIMQARQVQRNKEHYEQHGYGMMLNPWGRSGPSC